MEETKLHRLSLLLILVVTLLFTSFQCAQVSFNVLNGSVLKGNLVRTDLSGVALRFLPYVIANSLIYSPPGGAEGEALPPLELKGKDRRLAFKTKKDGGFGFALFDREERGTFDTRVTVSIGSEKGLVSASSPANILSSSRAAIEMDRPAVPFGEIPQVFTYIAAGWNADLMGFNVATFQKLGFGQPTPMIGSATFAGALSVELRMEQTDTELLTYARAAAVDGGLPNAWTELSSQAMAVPKDLFKLGIGVVGMEKKGTFFFDDFALSGPQIGGAEERGLLESLLEASLPLLEIREVLEEPIEGDIFTPLLDDARDALASVTSDIEAADEAQSLQANTEVKIALKAIKASSKRLDSAAKAAAKFKPKSLKIIGKRVEMALEKIEVAAANLMGLRAKSRKQLPAASLIVDED